MRLRLNNEQGSILISIMLIFPFFIAIMTAYMNYAVSGFRAARSDQFKTFAQFGADAGADKAMEQINIDGTWTGTTGEVIMQNDTTAKVTYEVSVADESSDRKLITSTGRSYRNASDTTPDSIIKIIVNARGVQSQNFSIITGVGGLELNNSAKVLGGDVFVNGTITMTNTSQIGLQTNPVNLQVAHQSCPSPPDATYPRLCASGENGQPISISNSAHIYADVRANNQTSTSGMSDPGLTASSGVDIQPLPPHDRAAQKAAATNNLTGAQASCTTNDGLVNWLANLKITGDVTISHKCTVTLNGDVWITGKLSMSNQGKIVVSDALGTTRPNIMIDGENNSFNNSATIASNNQNTGAQIITYWSDASCSPDCSDVTGTDLFDSRNDATITLDNSASGPQTIFYARWSKVLIQNSGQIGALVGQTVTLNNSGTVTFGSSVSGGNITFWVIDGYRRSF